jgi:flagellar biosynthetic protein FliR
MTTATALLLGGARMTPIGWVAPPLGGPSRAARLVVAAGLTLLVLPSLRAQPEPDPLATALLGEVLVGLLLGLVAALPMRAAEAAGLILDGAAQPWRRRGPLGDAYLLFALALFAAFDGPRMVIVAAAQSYRALPLGHVLDGAALPSLLAVGARLVGAAVTLAAPALAALLVADVALMLLGRAQPWISRTVDGLSLRLLVVVLASAAATLMAAHALVRAFSDAATLTLPP